MPRCHSVMVSWRRRSEAFATASVLVRAPNFRNRDSTWNFTVCSEMFSRRAMALLVMPSARAASTSSSRGVSRVLLSVSRIAPKPGSVASGARTIKPAAAARMAASIWLASAPAESTPGESRSVPPSVTTGRVSPGGQSPSASTTSAASRAPTTTCPASATTLLKAARRGKSTAWTATRSRPVSAGLPAASLMHRPFRNRCLHRNHLTAPDQAKICFSPDAVGTEISGDSSESMRRYPINIQDDVARHNSCFRRVAAFANRHDHQAAGLVGGLAQRIGHGDGLQADAQPPARDAAAFEQQRHDTFEGCGRNRDDLSARSEGRHAQIRAGGVEDGPTLLAAGEADIEHDAPVDEAAAAGMPFGAGEIDNPQPRA